MEVGLRVVRGPDWKWGTQDGGEGHLGTVVEIGRYDSKNIPFKTVSVQWDCGERSNYRVGYQNCYDLRVFDNAPCGGFHNLQCIACEAKEIIGIRWECSVCFEANLCSSCYMLGLHNKSHPFNRYEKSGQPPTEVPPRSLNTTTRVEARGIFKKARVVRGHDWDWDNQDGGRGKAGEVIDIRGWDTLSRRSVASVKWLRNINVYRVGHKGKVDLMCIRPGFGGFYYKEHLPILGLFKMNSLDAISPSVPLLDVTATSAKVPSQHPTRGSSTPQIMNDQCPFKVGDCVKVAIVNEDILRDLQQGHGGWNPRMIHCIGLDGTVHRITEHKDVRVTFNGGTKWTFNPKALTKVVNYEVREIVQVITDGDRVRALQENHGEWNDYMKKILGKKGYITQIYADGDLRVTINDQTWTLNPLCVTRVYKGYNLSKVKIEPNSEEPISSTTSEETKKPSTNTWRERVNQFCDDYSRPFTAEIKKEVNPGHRQMLAAAIASSKSDNQVSKLEEDLNPSLDLASQKNDLQDVYCLICDENFANLQFYPCLHQVCCSECSSRMKKCIDCRQVIEKIRYIDKTSFEIYAVMDKSGSGLSTVDNSEESSSSLAIACQRDESLVGEDNLEMHQRLKYLESRINEIEEANACNICLDRNKTVVFLCGHGACKECVKDLDDCHMCRKKISLKINLF